MFQLFSVTGEPSQMCFDFISQMRKWGHSPGEKLIGGARVSSLLSFILRGILMVIIKELHIPLSLEPPADLHSSAKAPKQVERCPRNNFIAGLNKYESVWVYLKWHWKTGNYPPSVPGNSYHVIPHELHIQTSTAQRKRNWRLSGILFSLFILSHLNFSNDQTDKMLFSNYLKRK